MAEVKWYPSAAVIRHANLTAVIGELGFADYDELYEWSCRDRAGFWGHIAARLGIRFAQPPDAVLDPEGTPEHPNWFPGAQLNIVDSCLRHDPEAPAIVHHSAGKTRRVGYGELEQRVNQTANGLAGIGVGRGDRVAIAMPMSLEAVIAYLAIVRRGAVVVSIADSFSVQEIRTRLRIAATDIVVTQDQMQRGGKTFPMYEKVVAAGARRAVVVGTGAGIVLRDEDVSWDRFAGCADEFDPAICLPGDHTNILFSSGTTGEPKAIPWTQVTPLKPGADGHYHDDIHSEDVVAWPTNLGWMMGPWLIYAALLNGACIALYDDAPTTRGFCEFVTDAGVTILGVVPSLVASWRSSGVAAQCDWSRIRLFSSTGEASNPDDMSFLMDLAGNKPLIDYIGGTELAGGYMAGTVLHPTVPGTFSTPTLGTAVRILGPDGEPAPEGELFIEPPAIGLSEELLNRDHHEVYYEAVPFGGRLLRRHGDRIAALPGGYFRAMGRADDAMNLRGVKVGSAEIERVLLGTGGVREAAAVAVEPPGGGPNRLVAYVVVDDPGGEVGSLRAEMQRRINAELNPLFTISDVVTIAELPRTASAKVMRRELRADYARRTRQPGPSGAEQ